MIWGNDFSFFGYKLFSNHNMTTFYYWIPIGWSIILFLFIGATYNLSMHYIFKKQTLKQYVEKQNKFFMFECMLNENCKKKNQSTLIKKKYFEKQNKFFMFQCMLNEKCKKIISFNIDKTNMLKNKTIFLCFNACWMKNAKKKNHSTLIN